MSTTTAERQHGYAKYKLEGCRCYTCAFAVSEYNLARESAIASGNWRPFVSAEPVREHARRLMAAGIGRRRIAALTGIAESTITKLVNGHAGKPPSQRVRQSLAAKIFSIEPTAEQRAEGAIVDAIGTHRRIQALAAIGWTFTVQAGRLGMGVSNFSALLGRDFVLRGTADRVTALYDELSMTPAPQGYGSARVRPLARRRGWFPPLAWDDETIDDPTATPVILPPVQGSDPLADEWTVQRVAAGFLRAVGLHRVERAEVIRRMLGGGESQEQIARRLGISPSFVSQTMTAAGLKR